MWTNAYNPVEDKEDKWYLCKLNGVKIPMKYFRSNFCWMEPNGTTHSPGDNIVWLDDLNIGQNIKVTKAEISRILVEIFIKINMDKPRNFEKLVNFCFEEVQELADEYNWHEGDVVIALRRWIETK